MHGSYWTRSRFSRRTALRGAGAATAGLAGAVLIGCGGDDDDETATATPGGGGGGTSTAEATETQVRDTSTPQSTAIKRGGTWSVANAGDPPTIYPYGNLSFETKGIGSYVYNRLYKRITFPGSDGGETLPGPDAAISAESDDGQTWTVTLREGLQLHDVAPVSGRELDSEDVLFSVGLIQAEESPNRDSVSNWMKVEAPDAHTVVFTLSAPSPTFTEQIADTNLLQLLPREADGGFDPNTVMIGGGPWVFREYRPSSGFSFDRHPNYYEQGEDGESLPYTDHLERPIIPEYANRLAQFLAGNLLGLGINAEDVLPTRDDYPELQWLGQVSQLQSIFYWDHATETDQVWKDDRFRKGVSMGLDRDSLTDLGYNTFALKDAGLPANLAWNNIIPAGWGDRWWLDPQSAEHGDSGAFFQYDPAEGKKMLQAAGAAEGMEIPYIYTNRYGGAFPPIAEAHIAMLEAIGLSPQTDVQDYSSQYITNTFQGDFLGMAFGYETPFPEAGDYWVREFGNDPSNHSKIIVPEMTDIDERQKVELDEEARRAIFHEGQILNAESMYYAPSQAGAGTSYTAYQTYVQGGIRDTLGYGAGVEEYIYYWLDV
jgi:peptide/nickel transport system substrate-binding protein